MAEDLPAERRAVGLDIGSNTFSCAALIRAPDGSVRVAADTSRAVRLSEGLSPGGDLLPRAVARGLAALEAIAGEFSLQGAEVAAVATAVLRMARDPGIFTVPAAELLGAPVRILGGDEEALMMSRGAVHGLEARGRPRIVVDVGGQSTELCWETAALAWRPESIPLGVVALSERHLKGDPPGAAQIGALRAEVRRGLEGAVPRELAGDLVGVAGTATALGRLVLGIGGFDREAIHGCAVDRATLARWTTRALSMTTAERARELGLGPGRADVFPAGLCVLEEVMDHLGASRLTVSANGLRVGAALSILEA